MSCSIRSSLIVALLALTTSPLQAHFNILLPQSASVKRGETVTVFYRWGHPFEHQLFDAPAPQSVFAIQPDGRKTDLKEILERITEPGSEGKNATAYQFRFTPSERGDFILGLHTPSIWMEEEQEFIKDSVKVVLHVQAQKGWNSVAGQRLEIMPLTRPYGLRPGMAFQARALWEAKPLAGQLVEIEHYNASPPSKLPPDEHITHTAQTDPNGCFIATLTEPGWWCLTAQQSNGQREHDGKLYPLRQRATLWVYVDQESGVRNQETGSRTPSP